MTHTHASGLSGSAVLLSAGVPDADRWPDKFDAFEITDAVSAVARAVLWANGTLVTASWPTIAPLLLHIAAEEADDCHGRVVAYRSQAFEPISPKQARLHGWTKAGAIVHTKRVGDEPADPVSAPDSILRMRSQMMAKTRPTAMILIGGGRGMYGEYALFRDLCPDAPIYAFGHPGGAAGMLVDQSPPGLRDELSTSDRYATTMRHVLMHLMFGL